MKSFEPFVARDKQFPPAKTAVVWSAALCKMEDHGQIVGGLVDGPLGFDNAISDWSVIMQELTLCKNIREIIQQKALQEHLTCIKRIYIEMGQLLAVEPAALIFSFEDLAEGTIAENAQLEIISVAAKAKCESCGKTVNMNQYYDSCSECGSYALTITQGEELCVKSMEIVNV